jgi:protein-disulfide isomerase
MTLIDAVTFLVGLSVVIVTTLVFLTWNGDGVTSLTFQDQQIPNWRELASVGHRFGPDDAVVTILEWGDYECPPCTYFEGVVRQVQDKHPGAVLRVYRHWPLTTHRYAYAAARAAECASTQGYFAEYHRLLYSDPYWLGDAFLRFAEEAGVPDIDEFQICIENTETVPEIERDIAAVKEMGGRGTPALVINGVYLGTVPDVPRLLQIVADAIEESRR